MRNRRFIIFLRTPKLPFVFSPIFLLGSTSARARAQLGRLSTGPKRLYLGYQSMSQNYVPRASPCSFCNLILQSSLAGDGSAHSSLIEFSKVFYWLTNVLTIHWFRPIVIIVFRNNILQRKEPADDTQPQDHFTRISYQRRVSFPNSIVPVDPSN